MKDRKAERGNAAHSTPASHAGAGKGSTSSRQYASAKKRPAHQWPVPAKSPPKIPLGLQMQELHTAELPQHLHFVVKQCAQKMPDWSGWSAVNKLASSAYWKQHMTSGTRYETVDDTQIAITPRLATCLALTSTYPRYKAELVFDISVDAPDPTTQVSTAEPTSSEDERYGSDGESRSLHRSRTVRTGWMVFRLPDLGMHPLTYNPSADTGPYVKNEGEEFPISTPAPEDEVCRPFTPPPAAAAAPEPLPPAIETFATHLEMKQGSMNYSTELARLTAEVEAGLGQSLTDEQRVRLMHMTQLRVQAQEALSLAQNHQARIDHQVMILRYRDKKAAGADGTYRTDGTYGEDPGEPSFLAELAGQVGFQYNRNKGHIKGIAKAFEKSSARYHKASMKSGNPFAPMLSGFMASAEGALNGITSGQATATEAIVSLLESRGSADTAIASFQVALGLAEMVLSAAELVMPFAKIAKAGKVAGGGMGALAHAGAGGRSPAGAIAAARALAPNSLSTNTIIMMASKLSSVKKGVGVTKGGQKRLTKEYRARYGQAKMHDHHLVPQALMNDRRFVDRMKVLGVKDVQLWIDKLISRIPRRTHNKVHSEGWNADWKTFLDKNPDFTFGQVRAHIKKLMVKYNVPKSSRNVKKYGRNAGK